MQREPQPKALEIIQWRCGCVDKEQGYAVMMTEMILNNKFVLLNTKRTESPDKQYEIYKT